ncbi:MAG TPA: nucleotidyltransferase family protein [Mucilaginibacter sp.]|jgi:predicted nucleotidyltransferase|nr:nucleotidyltransferase family protein [Mucilaginibacter sp.]
MNLSRKLAGFLFDKTNTLLLDNLYICSMVELSEIKDILISIKPELMKKYPISSIGLFGSIVRDDFNLNSDIDIIVDFNDKIGIEFITLADELEKTLNHKVDLVSRGGIKQKYFNVIEPEIMYV